MVRLNVGCLFSKGDENKYVIVSLVRSGVDKIGFLDQRNRKCVAQSRAKCGMYFIGNAETIAQSRIWKPMITHMQVPLRGCVWWLPLSVEIIGVAFTLVLPLKWKIFREMIFCKEFCKKRGTQRLAIPGFWSNARAQILPIKWRHERERAQNFSTERAPF